MLDFAQKLSLLSVLRYGAWRFLGGDRPVALSLRNGIRFELRRRTSGNNDYGVAYEVFVLNYYADSGGLIPKNVHLIVDLGANVGFSLLHFLHSYPSCRIIAYEPHPRCGAQIERNLTLDGTRGRVELNGKAAGAATRVSHLSDLGTSSSLNAESSVNGFAVHVEDVFPRLLGQRIDILKMDIEGGEYEILADPRFEELDIRAIVMEWHSRGGGHADKSWCEERLRNMGFTVRDIFVSEESGMFWAWRDKYHPRLKS
jgi:FkbM family methyltransferase